MESFFFSFSLWVTFNWSVLSTSYSVKITAGKHPHQSDAASANPISIYGLFTLTFSLVLLSCDFAIITPSLLLSVSVSYSIFELISLKHQSLTSFPIPLPLPLPSLFLPTDCPLPITRPLCLLTCPHAPIPSFLFLRISTHHSFHPKQLCACFRPSPMMDSLFLFLLPSTFLPSRLISLISRSSSYETDHFPADSNH